MLNSIHAYFSNIYLVIDHIILFWLLGALALSGCNSIFQSGKFRRNGDFVLLALEAGSSRSSDWCMRRVFLLHCSMMKDKREREKGGKRQKEERKVEEGGGERNEG